MDRLTEPTDCVKRKNQEENNDGVRRDPAGAKRFLLFSAKQSLLDELVVESCGNGKNNSLYLRVIQDVFEPRSSFRSANLLGLT